MGQQYHLDLEFDIAASETYKEKVYKKRTRDPATMKLLNHVLCDLDSCMLVKNGWDGGSSDETWSCLTPKGAAGPQTSSFLPLCMLCAAANFCPNKYFAPSCAAHPKMVS